MPNLPSTSISKEGMVTEENVLTREELRKHRVEAEAALSEELTIWIKHQTFSVVKRKPGLNNLTSRFVANWK